MQNDLLKASHISITRNQPRISSYLTLLQFRFSGFDVGGLTAVTLENTRRSPLYRNIALEGDTVISLVNRALRHNGPDGVHERLVRDTRTLVELDRDLALL